jgi:hypothetical protein
MMLPLGTSVQSAFIVLPQIVPRITLDQPGVCWGLCSLYTRYSFQTDDMMPATIIAITDAGPVYRSGSSSRHHCSNLTNVPWIRERSDDRGTFSTGVVAVVRCGCGNSVLQTASGVWSMPTWIGSGWCWPDQLRSKHSRSNCCHIY